MANPSERSEQMPAYVVSYVAVNDPDAMGRYATTAAPITEGHGGRYLFAGPGAETLDGEWPGDAMAIIEFPSREAAMRWYESQEYAQAKPLREAAGQTALIVTPDVE
jgi:uncharacterized protein (DUF1330 family)